MSSRHTLPFEVDVRQHDLAYLPVGKEAAELTRVDMGKLTNQQIGRLDPMQHSGRVLAIVLDRPPAASKGKLDWLDRRMAVA